MKTILHILGTPVERDTVVRLVTALHPIAASWNLFGEQIGIPKDEVDRIGVNVGEAPNRVSKCLSDAMTWWLNNNPNPTYEKIIDVLEGTVVSNRHLAGEIREKFIGKINYAIPLIRKWCNCHCMLIVQ